jgi:hypothetical protein
VDEQRYVVLETIAPRAPAPPAPSRRRRWPPTGREPPPIAEPPAAAVSVERFTPADAADARRAPQVAVAPVLPMKLV